MSSRIIANSETFRDGIQKKLSKLFEKEKEQPTLPTDTLIHNSNSVINYAVNLEKGVYNWSVKEATNRKVVKKWDNPFFVQIYLDRLRSVYINLTENKNIIKSIINKEIKSHLVAFMTHQEMCPEKWEEYIKKKIIRDKNKFEQNIEANTDSFTCRKCKSKKCSYYQLQTRSADEPMTSFITCISCGTRWKQ